MSLLTLDVQLPKTSAGSLPLLLNGSANDVISWNLLYSDPRSSYFRIELLGHARAQDVESRILEGCPEARVKIKDDSAFTDPLLHTTPRNLEFRKAFHRTSPEFIEDSTNSIETRADARKLAGIDRRILLLTDGSLHTLRQRALPALERDAYLVCKFTEFEGLPLLLDTRNEEEFIRNAIALSANAAMIRLSLLQRHVARATAERLMEQTDVPVVLAEQIETAAILAAIIHNAAAFHGLSLEGKNFGLVGLGPAMCGLAELLRRFKAGKIYGIDTEYSAASRFERDGGIATSLDFALERADFLVVAPQTPVLIDALKLRPEQVVLSFTPGTLAQPGDRHERFHYCQEPHPIYAAPGLAGAMLRFSLRSADAETSLKLARVLIERCGDSRFLPLPSESLIQAQIEALKPAS